MTGLHHKGQARSERALPDDLGPEETLPMHQRRFDRSARLLGDRGMCHLLDTLRRRGIPAVTSLGAAAKTDPTQIRVADLRDTFNDPFARDIRRILRRKYGWDLSGPTGLPAIFSTERPIAPTALYYDQKAGGFQCVCPPKDDRGHTCEERVQVEGSLGFVTGRSAWPAHPWSSIASSGTRSS
jgi:hypothetical protein